MLTGTAVLGGFVDIGLAAVAGILIAVGPVGAAGRAGQRDGHTLEAHWLTGGSHGLLAAVALGAALDLLTGLATEVPPAQEHALLPRLTTGGWILR